MQGDERERAFIKASFADGFSGFIKRQGDCICIERASKVRLGSNLRRPVFFTLAGVDTEFLIIDEKYDKIKWRIG